MKSYRIRNETGADEILEVTAESEAGVHVRITCRDNGVSQDYLDFFPSHLFEVLIRNGMLEDFDAAREAS